VRGDSKCPRLSHLILKGSTQQSGGRLIAATLCSYPVISRDTAIATCLQYYQDTAESALEDGRCKCSKATEVFTCTEDNSRFPGFWHLDPAHLSIGGWFAQALQQNHPSQSHEDYWQVTGKSSGSLEIIHRLLRRRDLVPRAVGSICMIVVKKRSQNEKN
jgi:hypothetical protein